MVPGIEFVSAVCKASALYIALFLSVHGRHDSPEKRHLGSLGRGVKLAIQELIPRDLVRDQECISPWEGGGDVWSRVSWLFSLGVPPESRIRDHICGQRPHLFFLALSAGLFPSTVENF